MKKQLRYLLITILVFNYVSGQNNNQEIGFISDNDLYVSLFLDGYYTNGLDLFYQKVKEKNETKYLHKISVGQKIYNAYQHDVPELNNQDRPYGGYTYINYQQTKVTANYLLGLGITLGYTGKYTGAKEAQNLIHVLYNIEATEGWNYQLKQQFEPRLSLYYNKNLYYNEEVFFQASLINHLNLGTIFSNASTGIAFKVKSGETKNAPITNTTFYNTALQTKNESWLKETYLGVKSYLTYQFLDKTVTGEIYNNTINKEFNTTTWVWHNDFGFYWSLEHLNISYHQVFHTQNVENMNRNWIRYGTIQLSYKF